MKPIIFVMFFLTSSIGVHAQCLDMPNIHFGGSRVEWALGTIDTFVKSPCVRYIYPREGFINTCDPIEIGDNIIYSLSNIKYGTVVQGINSNSGDLTWANYYNSTTEGYGYNYYMDMIKKSDSIFCISGTRYPIKVNSEVWTSNVGHATQRDVSVETGATINNKIIDTQIISYVASRRFHANNDESLFYTITDLQGHPSGNNQACVLLGADFLENGIVAPKTDTVFFNTIESNGFPRRLGILGPFIYGDSIFVYLAQYNKNNQQNQFIWSVNKQGKIIHFENISESIHGTGKKTYYVDINKLGDDIFLTTVTPDDSDEGNYGYVRISKDGKVIKANSAMTINGKKLGFLALTLLKNNELLIATRFQDQNDIFFFRETIQGDYVQAGHLTNPNRSVYALRPLNLLQTNDSGIVLTGEFMLDTFKMDYVYPFQEGGWPVIMKLSAETLGLPTATDEVSYHHYSFTITPNPTSDLVVIKLGEVTEPLVLHIRDQTGRLIMQKDISTSSSEIDVSSLASGLYIVTLSHRNGRQIGQAQKLVKM